MLHTQTLVNIVINLCNISFYIISERALCFSKEIHIQPRGGSTGGVSSTPHLSP